MLKYTLALCLFLSACASKQLAVRADQLESTTTSKVDASSEVINEYSDDYNILLQINLESKDGNWVRIEKAELDLTNDENHPYNIIVGKDLVAWAESKAEEKKIRDYNQDNSIAGVLVAGGAMVVVGVLSKSNELAASGAVIASGAAGYKTYSKVKTGKDQAQGVAQVPDTHLYAPFAIPSMSLVKKWVLINLPSGRIARTASLKLTTVEGETLSYRIRLAK